ERNSRASCEELVGLAEDTPRGRFLLDLGNIRFVISAGLGKLVALNRRVRAAGGRLWLVNLSPAVAQAIAVTRLDKVLEVEPQASPPQQSAADDGKPPNA